MNKLILHTLCISLLSLVIIILTTIVASANDTIPTSYIYQQHLDSAAVYAQQGDYRKATDAYSAGLNTYKEHYLHQMAILNQQLAQTYEMEKKKQELDQLNQTLSLRKTRTLLFTILIITLMTALILLFFVQKYRLRIVNQQKQQKENQTTLLKLDKEKKEMEVRLNTLQANKYQKELMADTMLVEHKNKILEDLRLFFENHPALTQYKADLETILTEHPDVTPINDPAPYTTLEHPDLVLYAHLQKQANNKLTPLDLKYCRMIYLKMTSKEMADLLQVDPKTIRVTKYRLKQKLNISKEKDLSTFIEEIANGLV